MSSSPFSRAAHGALTLGAVGLVIAALVAGHRHGQQTASAPEPAGGHAFVANAAENSLWSFRYDPTSGWLNPTAHNLGSGRFPASLAVLGQRLYSANLFGGSISGWQLDRGRGLALPGSPWPAGKGISLLLADTANSRLYAPLGAALAGWQVIADGSLRPLPGSPWTEAGSPAGLVLQGHGLWLGDAADKQLRRLALQADGSPGDMTSVATPVSVDSLALTPDGHYLLATASTANRLLVWKIDAQGGLSALPGSPYATGAHPVAAVVDNSNHFIYVANAEGGNISGWRLSDSGLTALPGSPYASGKGPHSLRLSPEGHYLFSSNSVDKTLSGYRIDAASGVLSEVPDSPVNTGYGPADIVFVP